MKSETPLSKLVMVYGSAAVAITWPVVLAPWRLLPGAERSDLLCKIGLVYDFSDFKTLAKYISDGRVTESDKLSHDGQTWTSIGEIADLEQHFVDVYKDAEAAMRLAAAGGDGTEDYEDDAPTNIVGMDNLADAIGAEQAATATGGASARQLAGSPNLSTVMDEAMRSGSVDPNAAPRFVDPFEARKKARATKKPTGRGPEGPPTGSERRPARPAAPRSAPAPEQKPQSSRAGLWLVALLLLVGSAGGYWFWQQSQISDGPGATVAPAPAPAPRPPPPKAGGDDERGQVQEDIENAGKPIDPDDGKGAEDEAFKVEGEKDDMRCARGPDGKFYCPDGTVRDAAGKPSKGSGGTAPAAAGGMEVGEKSARDHAADGDSALRRSDYAAAVASFRQAKNLDPRNTEYSGKLGVALFRSGDLGSAGNYLREAAAAGFVPAHDYLGDIARDQGDTAGAISHYQSYLQAGGSDAGRVQAKIDQLTGG